MFNSVIADGLTVTSVFICMAVSVLAGILIAVTYAIRSRYTKNFLLTLILLPVIVQTVIMMVNGNIGTGVAVLGAFSLIRFRSVPGNSKEICCIFFSMAAGLATGIGQIWFALTFTGVVCSVFLILKILPLCRGKQLFERELKITVAEDVDFERAFADILKKYTKTAQIIHIKTSDMGSLFVVTYQIRLSGAQTEKALIDDLRVVNGNLPIVCLSRTEGGEEL